MYVHVHTQESRCSAESPARGRTPCTYQPFLRLVFPSPSLCLFLPSYAIFFPIFPNFSHVFPIFVLFAHFAIFNVCEFFAICYRYYAFSKNRALTHLDLGRNNIDDMRVVDLAHAVMKNRGLLTLLVRMNFYC